MWLVALSVLPFLLLVLWFYVAASRGLAETAAVASEAANPEQPPTDGKEGA